MIFDFCEDLSQWLSSNDDHVAGVHCKAGKVPNSKYIGTYGVDDMCFSNLHSFS